MTQERLERALTQQDALDLVSLVQSLDQAAREQRVLIGPILHGSLSESKMPEARKAIPWSFLEELKEENLSVESCLILAQFFEALHDVDVRAGHLSSRGRSPRPSGNVTLEDIDVVHVLTGLATKYASGSKQCEDLRRHLGQTGE